MDRTVITKLAIAGTAVFISLSACGSTAKKGATSPPASRPSTSVAGGQAVSSSASVTITAQDFSYQLPATLGSGIQFFNLVNAGTSPHEFRFVRLNDGVSINDVKTAIRAKDRARLAALTEAYGGNLVNPGQHLSYAVDLKPGSYLVMSVESGADGVPDIAKGMMAPFTVSQSGSQGAAPSAAATVTMRDFAYDLPAGFGRGFFKVVNSGPSVHELRLFGVDAGKTLADVRSFLAQPHDNNTPLPAWFRDQSGGILDLAPGIDAWIQLDLAPGRYAAVSFLPDATQQPQWADGMLADFTVS